MARLKKTTNLDDQFLLGLKISRKLEVEFFLALNFHEIKSTMEFQLKTVNLSSSAPSPGMN
jgi:hypothetical protein